MSANHIQYFDTAERSALPVLPVNWLNQGVSTRTMAIATIKATRLSKKLSIINWMSVAIHFSFLVIVGIKMNILQGDNMYLRTHIIGFFPFPAINIAIAKG